ncbi:hypothetical protein ACOSQ4_027428 [Xanthoceras sorbifolium]
MQRNSKVLSSTMDDGTSRNLFNTPEPKGNGKSNKRLSTTNPDVLNSLHKDCGFILNQLKKEVYEYFNLEFKPREIINIDESSENA